MVLPLDEGLNAYSQNLQALKGSQILGLGNLCETTVTPAPHTSPAIPAAPFQAQPLQRSAQHVDSFPTEVVCNLADSLSTSATLIGG